MRKIILVLTISIFGQAYAQNCYLSSRDVLTCDYSISSFEDGTGVDNPIEEGNINITCNGFIKNRKETNPSSGCIPENKAWDWYHAKNGDPEYTKKCTKGASWVSC
jgi:hypothetical protein